MHTFSEEAFKAPPKAARPMVRWWWTGVDVQKDELIRELAELDERSDYRPPARPECLKTPPITSKARLRSLEQADAILKRAGI